MERLNIELPDSFGFVTDLDVRIYDVNIGGHLGHDSVIRLMHEARARFFGSLGYTELSVEGFGILIVDLLVQYRAEAFHQDSIQIKMHIPAFSSRGCRLVYQLVREQDQSEIARAQTGLVFYDYEKRRTVSVPDAFRVKAAEKDYC